MKQIYKKKFQIYVQLSWSVKETDARRIIFIYFIQIFLGESNCLLCELRIETITLDKQMNISYVTYVNR